MNEITTFPQNILSYPDSITVGTETEIFTSEEKQDVISIQDISLFFDLQKDQLDFSITSKETPLTFVTLKWNRSMPTTAKVLGDTWERGYGDLEWKSFDDCSVDSHFMPWYFFLHDNSITTGFGVMVRPAALCYWQINASGIILHTDLRNGGNGVHLNGRTIKAASIVNRQYSGCTAFEAGTKFCQTMCKDPIFPDIPVYGSNNWYYAYGDSTEEEILFDTDYVMELTAGIQNPPFMVIDDCWQEHHRLDEYNGGPWTKGNKKFPDMKKLAEKIEEKGARPGIWIRLLLNESNSIPSSWRLSHNDCLDPSRPEVLRYIKADVERMCQWGYRLIKHDFSTFDITGNWGFQMLPLMCKPEVTFYDKTKTTAEIIINFYEAIYEASKDYGAIILGCNTIGHLGAGLMQMNRTGDDTSGKDWEITKKMGINTLAFRLMQHKTFYDIDADCVGILGPISWYYNKQWTEVLANSGTPLFISAKPGVMTEEEKKQMHHYLEIASKQEIHAIPVDWQDNLRPIIWSDGKTTYHYNWDEMK